MVFNETKLAGAFLIELTPIADDRGFFARTFCRREFAERGLQAVVAQENVSLSAHRGTIRGLHFQFPPAAETKIVRCARGAMFDVIVDLRPESATYLDHVAVELSAANRRALYVPERFAHGFQVLEDQTETTYILGAFYEPEAQGGLLYSDPRLGIAWPLAAGQLSERDRQWPLLANVEPALRDRMTIHERT